MCDNVHLPFNFIAAFIIASHTVVQYLIRHGGWFVFLVDVFVVARVEVAVVV